MVTNRNECFAPEIMDLGVEHSHFSWLKIKWSLIEINVSPQTMV